MARDACWLYGVVPTGTTPPAHLRGVADEALELVGDGDVAFLAGALDADEPPQVSPETLLAHTRVLDTVAAETAVLPLRFGTVVNRGEVERALRDGHDGYAELLAQLAGAVQYSVRARYERDAVLREALAEDQELARLNAVTRDGPADGTYAARVRLGELVVAALTAKRDADAPVLLDRITPCARDLVVREPASPDDLLDAALLVDRDAGDRLAAVLEEEGRNAAGRVRIRLVGPQAPYDFVPDTEHVASAGA